MFILESGFYSTGIMCIYIVASPTSGTGLVASPNTELFFPWQLVYVVPRASEVFCLGKPEESMFFKFVCAVCWAKNSGLLQCNSAVLWFCSSLFWACGTVTRKFHCCQVSFLTKIILSGNLLGVTSIFWSEIAQQSASSFRAPFTLKLAREVPCELRQRRPIRFTIVWEKCRDEPPKIQVLGTVLLLKRFGINTV